MPAVGGVGDDAVGRRGGAGGETTEFVTAAGEVAGVGYCATVERF